MRTMRATLAGLIGITLVWGAAASAAPTPTAPPQVGSILKGAGKAGKVVTQLRDLSITEEEEIMVGAAVSERVRARYGVVQDKAVHRYVALVGTLIVKKSTRPNLPFTFIVLDTEGPLQDGEIERSRKWGNRPSAPGKSGKISFPD